MTTGLTPQPYSELYLPKTATVHGTNYELQKNDFDILLISDGGMLIYQDGLEKIHSEARDHVGKYGDADNFFNEVDITRILNEDFSTFIVAAE